jgi:hypothetical protein
MPSLPPPLPPAPMALPVSANTITLIKEVKSARCRAIAQAVIRWLPTPAARGGNPV